MESITNEVELAPNTVETAAPAAPRPGRLLALFRVAVLAIAMVAATGWVLHSSKPDHDRYHCFQVLLDGGDSGYTVSRAAMDHTG